MKNNKSSAFRNLNSYRRRKMKSRFSLIDLFAVVQELRQYIGMRLNNVYDINAKTYLLKLSKYDKKVMIIFESGIRLHSTEHGWSKNIMPSGFSMKLRKHLRDKRLEDINVVGLDRIVDMRFGNGPAAYHLLIELYDRGNVVLTDSEYVILNILRPRTIEADNVRYAVRETYVVEVREFKEYRRTANEEMANRLLHACQPGDTLHKCLVSRFPYGPVLFEHCLLENKLSLRMKVQTVTEDQSLVSALALSLSSAFELFEKICNEPSRGYLKMTIEENAAGEQIEIFHEFHPYFFSQFANSECKQFDTFNGAVDEYFSKLDSQKHQQKQLQQERAALKRLENVRQDHEQRLANLKADQILKERMAIAVELNSETVEQALAVLRSAIASKLEWFQINEMIQDARDLGDPVAGKILRLCLERNAFVMRLPVDVFENDQELGDTDTVDVEIDLALSSHQNSRRWFTQMKESALKQKKTIAAGGKALKSAELRTKEQLKSTRQKTNVGKVRKMFWFEKFHWFLSSDRLLVLAGRDAKQNEILVKRYLKPGDLYVHADLRGAASVVIKKSEDKRPIPPKTLNEAAALAICLSAAWESKVVTSAWWVKHDQVSKSAPSGEYLKTGGFMIRGKKNYLTASQLVMGFGLLFRLDSESAARHLEKRRQAEDEHDDKEANCDNHFQDEQRKQRKHHKKDISELSEQSFHSVNSEEFAYPDVEIPLDGLKLGSEIETQHEEEEEEKLGKATATAAAVEEEEDGDEDDEKEEEEEEEEEEYDVNVVQNETLDAIQCLTGNPTEDDNILFALPVCAPYAALNNYKFKVKLTPGTTKKGKAIKTAIDLFMHDRTAWPGLREFIKVIQEQDVARDFPGKVKVLAPNLHSVRKKR
ncbi:Nuclear export mediator factor NEMF [Trichinella pseudospiralis]|uniref:Nuclear export mediator factor NEMF n=1 Tax=Trichinella pseudospiralis TaxID=6337 RepID=A0A0V1IXG1_TRIPS|nr:Nuclear export mediator factor NEMF [Trichinella pseudospiralis]